MAQNDLPVFSRATAGNAAVAAALLQERVMPKQEVKTVQIQKVDFGPVEAPAEQPNPQPPIPRMAAFVKEGEKEKVWRMGAANLQECQEKGELLFKKTWPLMEGGNMLASCMQAMGDPSVLLIRSENAFGCAVAERTLYEPRLWVKEQWVFSLNKSGESLLIYKAMMDWAKSINAFRFTFGSLTEADLDAVAKRLGEHTVHKAYSFTL
jgi:hypothetical protein